jgi:hypothetical protein
MYDILVVDDDLMQHDEWMLLEHDQGMTLIMRRSTGPIEDVIAQAWGASRLLEETPGGGGVVIPMPRRPGPDFLQHPSAR